MKHTARRLISILLALALVLSLIPAALAAEPPYDGGKHGENITWEITLEGTLTISGQGAMIDKVPEWTEYADLANRIIIQEGVTSICAKAFYMFALVEEISIPASMKQIGSNAFTGVGGCLEKVSYPGTVAALTSLLPSDRYNDYIVEIFRLGSPKTSGQCGPDAFWSLSDDGVVTVSGKGAVTNPDWDAFSNTFLEIVIEEGITEIRRDAFTNCYNVTSLTLPMSLQSIESGADRGLLLLQKVYYPGSAAQLRQIYKSDNSNLIRQYFLTVGETDESISWILSEDGTLSIFGNGPMPDYAYNRPAPWQELADQIKSVLILDGIMSIGDHAFEECSSLASVTIPASVTYIGQSAFADCTSLAAISFSDSIRMIDDFAFAGSGITNLVLPESIEELGVGVFSDCKALVKVTLPDTMTTISTSLFKNCSSLASVTIPASVTSLENEAFAGCTALSRITFAGSAPMMESDCFAGVTAAAYYPANDPTWTADVRQDYWGKITWATLDHVCPTTQFTDVPKSTNWAHEGIDFAVANGLFNGMSATTFGPNETMTRAMLVTVLWRLEGQPKPTGANPFTDVRSSQYYADPVVWAAENGIVNGIGNGKFNPNGNITREQMSAILYRYSVMKGFDTSARADLSGFPDAKKVSSWATDSLSWANATGLITGSSVEGTVYLLPGGNATRAQVATILMRFVNSI